MAQSMIRMADCGSSDVSASCFTSCWFIERTMCAFHNKMSETVNSRIYRHWTTKEGFRGTDLFVDFATMECHSIRNDRCLFSEVWHHKQFGWIRRWTGLQFNREHSWTWWFKHRKPIWIRLWVRIWRFRCLGMRCLKTLNILLESNAIQ